MAADKGGLHTAPRCESAISSRRLNTSPAERPRTFFCTFASGARSQSWGSGHEYIRQSQQLHTTVNGQYVDRNDTKEVYYKRARARSPLRTPRAIDGKPVLNVDNLGVILTFNIGYDTTIFPGERHRINLAGCYQLSCYAGARPAGAGGWRAAKAPKDGSIHQLSGQSVVRSSCSDGGEDQDTPADEESKGLLSLLSEEDHGKGTPGGPLLRGYPDDDCSTPDRREMHASQRRCGLAA
ncbi:Protein of unknown function (DUF3435) [Geosmithia morbida]|uniref:Uncharacterized protein n=1 Tax=Geosmithia morbida TaxID=1094350 RepID=A0A9P4Z5B9_9HYPO|nr:Protein of unknown function (DUF3435) [Geosmithia morbida]KAF4126974.1 Protein of unknown function (DUF3435) [Geosmithia morbida]